MNERQEQMIAQCRVVAHLAKALADVYSDKAKIYAMKEQEAGFVDLLGRWSAAHMEALGEILNGMDAVDDEEDDWTAPIFHKAHEFWPTARE